jgi:hypothetical protein
MALHYTVSLFQLIPRPLLILLLLLHVNSENATSPLGSPSPAPLHLPTQANPARQDLSVCQVIREMKCEVQRSAAMDMGRASLTVAAAAHGEAGGGTLDLGGHRRPGGGQTIRSRLGEARARPQSLGSFRV